VSDTSARNGRIYGFIVEDNGEPSLPIPSVHTPLEELEVSPYHHFGSGRSQRSRAATASSYTAHSTFSDDEAVDEDRALLGSQMASQDRPDFDDEDEEVRMAWIQSQV
jgi:hypothetical protein